MIVTIAEQFISDPSDRERSPGMITTDHIETRLNWCVNWYGMLESLGFGLSFELIGGN